MNIYKITNKTNGKIYIGKESGKKRSYFGSGNIIKLAIKKYGKCNFTKDILSSSNDEKLISYLEQFWIQVFDCIAPKGYNISPGGAGVGYKHTPKARRNMNKEHLRGRKREMSEEWKKNILDANKKRWANPAERDKMLGDKNPAKRQEIRDKISEANIGRICSQETRIKIKETLKSKYRSGEIVKVVSEEVRKKISISKKGKSQSKERREKQSEAIKKAYKEGRKSRVVSKETIAKMKEAWIKRKEGGWEFTADVKKRMSESHKGKSTRVGCKHSEETKKKISESKKKQSCP